MNLSYEMLVAYCLPLIQIILDLIYPPPADTNHLVSCFDILYFAKPALDTGANNLAMFLRKFNKTRGLDWLNREDVHLFSVTETHFVFSRTTPGVDVHDVTRFPWLCIGKKLHSVELGEISIDLALDLIRNREEEDGSNIGILHNLGRCGSTLVANMIYRTGQCQVLAEPGPLLDISASVTRNPELSTNPIMLAKLRAVLLYLARSPDRRYFIKPAFVTYILVTMIHKVLPRVREVFLYRALKPMAISSCLCFGLTKMPYAVAKRQSVEEGFYRMDLHDENERNGIDTMPKFILYAFLVRTQVYVREAITRSHLPFYSYESLLADPRAFITHLLIHIGLGPQWADGALEAMSGDSQKDSRFSREIVNKLRSEADTVISKEAEDLIRMVAHEKFGIELRGSEMEMINLPNQWNELVMPSPLSC